MEDFKQAKQAREDGWLQLVDGADVRQRESCPPEPRPLTAGNQACWMLTSHPKVGKLLENGDGNNFSLSTTGLLLSPPRRGAFSRVVEVCHRRIWVDNKDTLWEGQESKIPPRSSLEAKLFHRNVTLFQARRGSGEFVGGALVQGFDVPAAMLELPFVGTAHKAGEMPEVRAEEFMPVGYVDCFATERGSRAGAPLWAAIRRLPFCVVALHTVLTERTVEFWRSCGLHRADVESEGEQKAFRDSVQLHSQGRVELHIQKVAEALPKSALPLFVWVNSEAIETWRPRADAAADD
mmetsp:Transcript_40765/g.126820  ORF Transcript_40765/g.126820 Transcript_40765/m.126820 type:complete len:293 (+) Transcript_40765:1-879(+)